LIDIGTSGGKTLIAAGIIAELGLPTLVLVTTRTLFTQTVENLRNYLDTQPGIIGQGINRPGRLTVALIQSIDPQKSELSPWHGGLLLFDEGHHSAAPSYVELICRINPRYHFYLSAVPFRTGEDQAVLDALCGVPLTEGRYSSQYLIDKGYACPVEVKVKECRIEGDMTEKTFHTLYEEFIVHNQERNKMIAQIANEEMNNGRSVLILIDRIQHGHELEKQLYDRAAFVHGSTNRGLLEEKTKDFSNDVLHCLIATSGLFAEGISINGIHVLILGGALQSRRKIIQAVGRGMRLAPGKQTCRYYDFYDNDKGGVLQEHALKRLMTLKEEGFNVSIPRESGSALPPAEAIPPSWFPVSGTKQFALIDGQGHISARSICMKKEYVPRNFCKKCVDSMVCQKGGRLIWQEGRD